MVRGSWHDEHQGDPSSLNRCEWVKVTLQPQCQKGDATDPEQKACGGNGEAVSIDPAGLFD